MGKKSAASSQIDALIGKAGKKGKSKGKKGRKIGRTAKHPSSCRYKGEQRWISNKVRRMERHIRRYPDDKQARGLLSALV